MWPHGVSLWKVLSSCVPGSRRKGVFEREGSGHGLGSTQRPRFFYERDTENNVVQVTQKKEAPRAQPVNIPHSKWRESPQHFVHGGRVTIHSCGTITVKEGESKGEQRHNARIELHRRIHAAWALPCRICGTSRTLPDAKPRRN